jgi:hypothetical protein
MPTAGFERHLGLKDESGAWTVPGFVPDRVGVRLNVNGYTHYAFSNLQQKWNVGL